MNEHSIRAAFHNHVRAKRALAKMGKGPKAGRKSQDFDARSTSANAGYLETTGVPHEVTHLLTDYRDGNKVICRKTMNRKEAFEMNKRLL